MRRWRTSTDEGEEWKSELAGTDKGKPIRRRVNKYGQRRKVDSAQWDETCRAGHVTFGLFPQTGRRGMLTWEENRNTCQIVILSGLRRDFDDATSVTRLRRRDFAISTKKLCFRVITTSSDYDYEGLRQRNYVIETQNKNLKGSDEAVFTPQRRFSFVDGPPTARQLRLRIRSGIQRKLRFQLRRDVKIRNKVDYFPMGAVWRINLFAFLYCLVT